MAEYLGRTIQQMIARLQSRKHLRGDREYIMVSSFFAYISYPFMEVYDMNTLSAIFGFGACIAIISFIAWMVVDAFMVLKHGLVDDDICNKDED